MMGLEVTLWGAGGGLMFGVRTIQEGEVISDS